MLERLADAMPRGVALFPLMASGGSPSHSIVRVSGFPKKSRIRRPVTAGRHTSQEVPVLAGTCPWRFSQWRTGQCCAVALFQVEAVPALRRSSSGTVGSHLLTEAVSAF